MQHEFEQLASAIEAERKATHDMVEELKTLRRKDAARILELEGALRDLVQATSSREATMGDPIDLFNAKAEVMRANARGRAALRSGS